MFSVELQLSEPQTRLFLGSYSRSPFKPQWDGASSRAKHYRPCARTSRQGCMAVSSVHPLRLDLSYGTLMWCACARSLRAQAEAPGEPEREQEADETRRQRRSSTRGILRYVADEIVLAYIYWSMALRRLVRHRQLEGGRCPSATKLVACGARPSRGVTLFVRRSCEKAPCLL